MVLFATNARIAVVTSDTTTTAGSRANDADDGQDCAAPYVTGFVTWRHVPSDDGAAAQLPVVHQCAATYCQTRIVAFLSEQCGAGSVCGGAVAADQVAEWCPSTTSVVIARKGRNGGTGGQPRVVVSVMGSGPSPPSPPSDGDTVEMEVRICDMGILTGNAASATSSSSSWCPRQSHEIIDVERDSMVIDASSHTGAGAAVVYAIPIVLRHPTIVRRYPLPSADGIASLRDWIERSSGGGVPLALQTSLETAVMEVLYKVGLRPKYGA